MFNTAVIDMSFREIFPRGGMWIANEDVVFATAFVDVETYDMRRRDQGGWAAFQFPSPITATDIVFGGAMVVSPNGDLHMALLNVALDVVYVGRISYIERRDVVTVLCCLPVRHESLPGDAIRILHPGLGGTCIAALCVVLIQGLLLRVAKP